MASPFLLVFCLAKYFLNPIACSFLKVEKSLNFVYSSKRKIAFLTWSKVLLFLPFDSCKIRKNLS